MRRRRHLPPRPPRGTFPTRTADGGTWTVPPPRDTGTVPTPENERWLLLGYTAAERYPLINALPPEERARILASLRAVRAALGGERVSPDAAPVPPPAWCPPAVRDTARDAGTLSRGQYRGVPVPARTHAPECPWARETWPLTLAGEIIPCACGAAGAILRAVAGEVSARSWLARELDRILGPRAAWAVGTVRQRKRWRTAGNAAVRAGMGAGVRIGGEILRPRDRRPPAPAPGETWEAIRDRLWIALRESARERERIGLALAAGWIG